jgi:hypothetical protein
MAPVNESALATADSSANAMPATAKTDFISIFLQ